MRLPRQGGDRKAHIKCQCHNKLAMRALWGVKLVKDSVALWSRRTVFINCGCCQLFSWLNGMQRDLCTEMPTFGSVPCHALPFQLCRLLGACCRSKGPQVDFRLSVEPLLPKTVAQPCRCSLWKVCNVSVSNLCCPKSILNSCIDKGCWGYFIRFHTLVPRTLLKTFSLPFLFHCEVNRTLSYVTVAASDLHS